MTTGRRYTGPDRLSRGIADAAADADDVLPQALARARALAPKAGSALGAIKDGMNAHALQRPRAPQKH